MSVSGYPSDFDEGLRKSVREDAGFMCENCGMSQGECLSLYGRKLSVHHKDENKSNNKKDNLVALCSKCHAGIHDNEERIL